MPISTARGWAIFWAINVVGYVLTCVFVAASWHYRNGTPWRQALGDSLGLAVPWPLTLPLAIFVAAKHFFRKGRS